MLKEPKMQDCKLLDSNHFITKLHLENRRLIFNLQLVLFWKVFAFINDQTNSLIHLESI